MTSLLQRRKVGRDPDSSVYKSPSVGSVGLSSSLPLHYPTNTASPTTTRRLTHRKKRHCPSLRLCFGSGLFVVLFLLAYYVLVPFIFRAPRSAVRLPVANVDVVVPNATEWPLIHIVNTRFMQEQAGLTTLGMARLHLFWTFCFPTMIGQSTQQFLWIIKTDPLFCSDDNPLFQQLVETVQPYPNIYIVASNNNFLISPELKGCWRDGEEGRDLLQSKIYTGNMTRLYQAIALREERPILETRLDADDGLHKLYLAYMQYVALKRFVVDQEGVLDQQDEEDSTATTHQGDSSGSTTTGSTTKWLYWCTRRHLEWRSSPTNESSSKDYSAFGLLNPVEHSKLCITPGITVGYNVGVEAVDVPSEAHDLLYKRLVNSTACYQHHHPPSSVIEAVVNPNKPLCLDLVDDLLFSAVRSRTWTSAGMLNVQSPDHSHRSMIKASDKLWQLLEERFNLNRTQAQRTQDFLHRHKAQIAYENLLGQCTSYHSCKQQAKEELERYTKEGQIHILHPTTTSTTRFIGRTRLRAPWYLWPNPALTPKEERL